MQLQVRLKDLVLKKSRLTPQELYAVRRWLGEDWRTIQYDPEALEEIEPIVVMLA